MNNNAFTEVLAERGHQIEKGYTHTHDDELKGIHLVQEIDFRVRLILNPDQNPKKSSRDYLIQVAALALAAIEEQDRFMEPGMCHSCLSGEHRCAVVMWDLGVSKTCSCWSDPESKFHAEHV